MATTSSFRAVLLVHGLDGLSSIKWLCETSGWLVSFCGALHTVLAQLLPRLLMLHGDLFVVQLLYPAAVASLHGTLIRTIMHKHNSHSYLNSA